MKKLFIAIVLMCMALFCQAQITDKATLKSWFQTGDKPTQEQFWHWMDSYWHKSETIPFTSISGFEPGTDSVYSHYDTIFGSKNGVEYIVGIFATNIATLSFGTGFVPGFFNGLLDYTANIDTTFIETVWAASQILSSPSDTFNFSVIKFVDTPLTGVTTGAAYLIVHSPSQFLSDGTTNNPFYTKFDQIAKYNGTGYDYFIPQNNDIVIVTNTEALYKYSGTYPTGNWSLTKRAWTVGGVKLGINPIFGTLDNKDVILITHGNEIGRFMHDGTVRFNAWAHAGSDLDSNWILQPRTDGTVYVKKETPVVYDSPLYTVDSPDVMHVRLDTTGLGGSGGGGGGGFDTTANNVHSTGWNDLRYYPLSSNPAGYLTSYTETDPFSLHITDTAIMLNSYLRSNIAAATYVPLTRTITINGIAHDLSTNQSWTVSGVSASDTTTLNVHSTPYNNTQYVRLDGSYANPAWITSLDFNKLTNINYNDTVTHIIYKNSTGTAPALVVEDTTEGTSPSIMWRSTSGTAKRWFRQYSVNSPSDGFFQFEWSTDSSTWTNFMSYRQAANSLTFAGTMIASAFTGGALSSNTGDPQLNLQGGGTYFVNTNSVNVVSLAGITMSKTGGTQKFVRIEPTLNEASGTASNYLLCVNPTITAIGSGTNRLGFFGVSNSEKFGIGIDGTLYQYRPTLTNGSTPSYTLGTGAGTSATASFGTGANDIAGSITINTGTSPTASGDVITISFATALTNTPKAITLTAAGQNAATEYTKFYIDDASLSTTSFKIKNTSSALTASTTYKFYYTITQ